MSTEHAVTGILDSPTWPLINLPLTPTVSDTEDDGDFSDNTYEEFLETQRTEGLKRQGASADGEYNSHSCSVVELK